MTELQSSINSLKEVITSGNRLLFKLEKAQKDLEKPKVPNFPACFAVVPDVNLPGHFVIGLKTPYGWWELPGDFKGRACFCKAQIQQIIDGLQMLIGDKDD